MSNKALLSFTIISKPATRHVWNWHTSWTCRLVPAPSAAAVQLTASRRCAAADGLVVYEGAFLAGEEFGTLQQLSVMTLDNGGLRLQHNCPVCVTHHLVWQAAGARLQGS